MGLSEIVSYIKSKGFKAVWCERTPPHSIRNDFLIYYAVMKEGYVLLINSTNPKTYEESVENDTYKFIHQIDGPPKFTVENVTVIRKQGELILNEGVIEWEGFDLFRETILKLVTWEEAIKIIDTWK